MRSRPIASTSRGPQRSWRCEPAPRKRRSCASWELALRARAQEAPQLRFLGPSPPRGLPLHDAKRAEIALRAEELLDQRGARRADELFLQILHADMKAHPLQVGTRPGRAGTGRRKAPPDDVLCPGITQPGETCPCPLGAEPPQVACDCVRAADRNDRDAFRAEAPTAAAGQRYNSDLVADALGQDDGAGAGRPAQRHHSCLGRGFGAAHITGKELAAPVNLHQGTAMTTATRSPK